MDENQAQYIRDLVEGRVKPSNPYAQTLVDQLRAAEKASAEMAPQIEQANAALQQLQQRRIGLAAVARQTAMTLVSWRNGPSPVTAEDSEP